MNDPYSVIPVPGPIDGTIRPPGSKSLTNRALVIASLARGRSRLTGTLASRDTEVMIEGLETLGIDIACDTRVRAIDVVGCGGRPPAEGALLRLENSGTSIRFLTAMVCLGSGRFELDGNQRMRQRPIGDLVDALADLGVEIECTASTGCPPVVVTANGLAGGSTRVLGTVSSQFISGLLLAAPCAAGQVAIELDGLAVSQPYIDMTVGLMRHFGAAVDVDKHGVYRVEPGGYQAADYAVEPDASSASYFLAAAAVTGGTVTIEGLGEDSPQGDAAFAELLEQMGCTLEIGESQLTLRGGPLAGIDVDMSEISDTSQTLAVVAAFADGPTRIRGIAHARAKETDRVTAMVNELRRLGLAVDEHDDGLTVHPGPVSPATIEVYDDHRMAMSFAVAGLRVDGIRIADPECTAKTYPGFFNDLERLCETAR